MTFSLSQLLATFIGFLLILLLVALATNRGYLPKAISTHPATFILALGVYASAWTFYGATSLAQNYGYAYLASYFGASVSFFIAPIILLPLLRITKSYQLSSVADLFAFRFRSQLAGSVTTLTMLAASLPLISMQIEAIVATTELLSDDTASSSLIAGVFCLLVALFAILFGSRHPSVRHRTAGLVTAMALGVLIKLVAIVGLALFAVYAVFGSNAEMESWLQNHTPQASLLYTPIEGNHWRSLLLSFITSAVVMPHMFHLLFTENSDSRVILKASWGFPLLLLLLSISTPPILWAGIALGIDTPPDYYSLMIGLHTNTPLLSLLIYIGGLAAASGLMIVTSIALAGMMLNHLVLPSLPGQPSAHLYRRLVWTRAALILLIMLLGYLFFLATDETTSPQDIGLIAFIAFMQFLPGLLATLFWPGGSRHGFIPGLIIGMAIWLIPMLGPLIPHADQVANMLQLEAGHWHEIATLALGANIITFILLSTASKNSPEERLAANSCILSSLHRPQGEHAQVADVQALINLLRSRVGLEVAEREVEAALQQLQLGRDETRPEQLEQIQDQLEINLSAILGPVEAMSVLRGANNDGYRRRDIHLVETHLERSQDQLSGLASELDELRRLHRNTLLRMPVGVCSLGESGEILLWNVEMEHFTGIGANQVIGQRLSQLPSPWHELLGRFAQQDDAHRPNQRISIDGHPRYFSLHKASLEEEQQQGSHHQVLLLEDQTENQLLADELAHTERLASVGRLAAGVAHEVGNPITGIACLAQNLKYETDPEEINQTGEQILEQTNRVDNIIKSLMNFSHSGNQYRPGSQQNLRLNDCVKQAIELVKLDSRRKQLNYLNLCDSQLQIHGDLQRLLQVFVNLLNNAADASEPGQSVRIQSYQNQDSILIHIEDQGCGIPEELQGRLFEPFFTTKEPGKGTGLGLAMIYSIIEEHYGNIQIESPADVAENRGTRVILTLPKASIADSTREPV